MPIYIIVEGKDFEYLPEDKEKKGGREKGEISRRNKWEQYLHQPKIIVS